MPQSSSAVIPASNRDDFVKVGGRATVQMGTSGAGQSNNGRRGILIRHLGQDRLVGGADDDMLIGRSSNGDEDDALLMAALAAWTSSDDNDERVAAVDTLMAVQDEEEDLLTPLLMSLRAVSAADRANT